MVASIIEIREGGWLVRVIMILIVGVVVVGPV